MTKHTILFLAANPLGTDRLALDEEARAIQEELERSGHRDKFELVTRWAARPLDLLRELRKLRPTVVHFSGHGGRGHPDGHRAGGSTLRDVTHDAGSVGDDHSPGLLFQGPDGSAQMVSTAALEETFGAAGSSVRLVILNACYSEMQADALLTYVGCVVGMGNSISDDAARSFAIGFYGGLGDRRSVAEAYKHGRAAIALEGLPDPEHPQLRVRAGVDADGLVMAAAESGRGKPRIVLGSIVAVILAILAGLVALPAFRGDARNAGVKSVVADISAKITRLWGEFESISARDSVTPLDNANNKAIRIHDNAIQFADDLLAIDDMKLDYRSLVIKWQCISYVYGMAAALEQRAPKRVQLAGRTAWAADYALYLVEEVRARALRGESGYKDIASFLDRDLAKGRMLYLIAVSLAIRYQSSDSSIVLKDVHEAISRIPDSYKVDVPLAWNPWLRAFAKGQE